MMTTPHRLLALFCIAMAGHSCAGIVRGGAAKPADAFAEFNGSNVYYQNFGAGETAVVLVHGWACDHDVWRFVAPELSRQARIVSIDLPGHGRSGASGGGYQFSVLADSIDAVLQHGGIQKAVLIGHSNGMPVIREFYRRHPEKTLGLVNIDGTLRGFFKSPSEAAPFLSQFRAPSYREAVTRFVKSMRSPHLSDEIAAGILETAIRTPQRVIADTLEASVDPAVWSPDPITVPFQLILAQQPAWGGDYKSFVMSIAPAADYRVFTNVGHFIQLERPEIVNSCVREFFKVNGFFQ